MPQSTLLILEDGSGKTNSNSYADRPYADNYFNVRGMQKPVSDGSAWPDDSSDATPNIGTLREQALIRATDYIDYTWGHIFKGAKILKAQALKWPRVGATIDGSFGGMQIYIQGTGIAVDGFLIDSNEIPDCLKRATCELAVRSLQYGSGAASQLAPDIDIGQGSVIEETVGTISVKYDSGRVPYVVFRYVETLIQPILAIPSGQAMLTRG